MTKKQECLKKIIKDLIPFAITAVITIVIMIVGAVGGIEGFKEIYADVSVFEGIVASVLVPLILGFEVAGFIIGWKWLSNYVKARNLLGFFIKLIIATLVGYILYPVILVKDIIAYCKA